MFNIKKIIKEEIDDFDWIRDQEPPLTIFDLIGYKIIPKEHPWTDNPVEWEIVDVKDSGHVNHNIVRYKDIHDQNSSGRSGWGEKYFLNMIRSNNYTLLDKNGDEINPHRVLISGEDPNKEFDYYK